MKIGSQDYPRLSILKVESEGVPQLVSIDGSEWSGWALCGVDTIAPISSTSTNDTWTSRRYKRPPGTITEFYVLGTSVDHCEQQLKDALDSLERMALFTERDHIYLTHRGDDDAMFKNVCASIFVEAVTEYAGIFGLARFDTEMKLNYLTEADFA